MKENWLRFEYILFLGFNRLIQRLQRCYLKVIGYRSEIPTVVSAFDDSDDLSFTGLITRYFINRMVYDDSKPDYIKTPDFTVKSKNFNCNDFSMLLCYILSVYRGWLNPRLMIVYAPNERGHCVCVFYTKDGYCHTSNSGLMGYYHSFEDLAASVYSNWSYYVVTDVKLNLLTVKLR